jgi:site-specific DNA-methyltransferase (adenine-specific)
VGASKRTSENIDDEKATEKKEIANEFEQEIFKTKSYLLKKDKDKVYIDNNAILINGEAIEEMRKIKDASIDCIVADLPYGTTMNPWDSIIPLEQMWKQFNRILKKGGNIILTASQPFTSILVSSNLKQFKYEIIWEKTIGSGQLNINVMPLKKHESILVFVKEGEKRTYNEQLSEGTPYTIKRNISVRNGYGKQTPHEGVNAGFRRETSIWKIPNPRMKNGHPTQKPVELLQKIVKTYSNEGDLVLDCTFGSCSTGIACLLEQRKFIGIELDPNYFRKGGDWISETQV